MIYEVNLYRVVGDTLIGNIPKVVQVPSKSDGSGAASVATIPFLRIPGIFPSGIL